MTLLGAAHSGMACVLERDGSVLPSWDVRRQPHGPRLTFPSYRRHAFSMTKAHPRPPKVRPGLCVVKVNPTDAYRNSRPVRIEQCRKNLRLAFGQSAHVQPLKQTGRNLASGNRCLLKGDLDGNERGIGVDQSNTGIDLCSRHLGFDWIKMPRPIPVSKG